MRLLALAALALATPALAQEAGDVEKDQRREIIDILRQDIRADRAAIVVEALELNKEQFDAFWPIYQEYQKERDALADERMGMIREYAAHFSAMTDDLARELGKRTFALEEKTLRLEKQAYERVAKAVDPITATRFMQVDRQISRLMQLQIAAELPLIRRPKAEPR